MESGKAELRSGGISMKKLLAMMLVLTMTVSMTACGGKSEEPAEAPAGSRAEYAVSEF